MKNPWGERYEGTSMAGCATCDARDRIEQIRKSTDAAWLHRCLAYGRLQTIVKHAIQVRLRKLARS